MTSPSLALVLITAALSAGCTAREAECSPLSLTTNKALYDQSDIVVFDAVLRTCDEEFLGLPTGRDCGPDTWLPVIVIGSERQRLLVGNGSAHPADDVFCRYDFVPPTIRSAEYHFTRSWNQTIRVEMDFQTAPRGEYVAYLNLTGLGIASARFMLS